MSGEIGYEELREKLVKNFTPEEVKKIDKAYNLARDAHDGQLRYSGQPYIIHPVAVAAILVDLCMDYQSVVAALLHDTVEDTDISVEYVKNEFGEDVAMLVEGVTKLEKIPFHSPSYRN